MSVEIAEVSGPRRRWAAIAIVAALAIGLLALVPSAASGSYKHHSSSKDFKIKSLSARADAVSGGDVLASVRVPRNVSPHGVRIELNGDDITDSFAPKRPGSRELVGLVEDLALGKNRLTAELRRGQNGHHGHKGKGRSHKGNGRSFETWGHGKRGHGYHGSSRAQLELVNHPITGPVFSGPHQEPFFCDTDGTDLGPPEDENCSTPTRVDYFYRSTATNSFEPLADPASRPSDLAQTTTRDGETVDYVIRMESGTINRSVYRWAVLADGGETGAGWNERVQYQFGGGCGTPYRQGNLGQGSVLDDGPLSEGYAVASASLNTFGNNCNDVISAETMSMVKERVIEGLGTKPAWTMGWGGSGGAIQQLMISQNYPGLLDGIIPSATFQDNALPGPADCRLLNAYFAGAGSGFSIAKRSAIMGYRNFTSCIAWDLAFADVIVPDRACGGALPPELIYNAVTNPGGTRCTLWDNQVNIYGKDPATGFAPRTLDNVGVEYGKGALEDGTISMDEFLDLNEGVGGYDNDGNIRPERAVGDVGAIKTAYRTGRVNHGLGGLPEMPILDLRYWNDSGTDIHTYIHSYIVRERLRQATGTAENQIMWRTRAFNINGEARRQMAEWLDAIKADRSKRSKARKVIANKPATAVDACWTAGGERINDPAEIDATGPCTQLYPPAENPRLVAGSPLAMRQVKCRTRPADPSDYGPMTPEQEQRLQDVFPDGVCDYDLRGIGERNLKGTWLSFGS